MIHLLFAIIYRAKRKPRTVFQEKNEKNLEVFRPGLSGLLWSEQNYFCDVLSFIENEVGFD